MTADRAEPPNEALNLRCQLGTLKAGGVLSGSSTTPRAEDVLQVPHPHPASQYASQAHQPPLPLLREEGISMSS